MTTPLPVRAVEMDARWRRFEPEWFEKRYPDVPLEMPAGASAAEKAAALEKFYRKVGGGYGQSPNRYFDEVWYCERYPDVRKGLISGKWSSGFAHYCAEGYRDRSPHWLFDEPFYRRLNPDLTDGFLQTHGFPNGYAHYLEKGEAEGRVPGPLVDLGCLQKMAEHFPEWFSKEGLLASWLVLPSRLADSARLSWYFDPEWYVQRYPHVQRAIHEGRVTSALHHYLTNETPQQFDPSPYFSESWYLAHSPDLQSAVENGSFRNGFEHFVRFGAKEGRQPMEGVDLRAYAANPLVQSQCRSGAWASPFARYVAEQTEHASPTGALAPEISEIQSRQLFKERAEISLRGTAREKLDFSFSGQPEVSVLMVLHGKLELTLQTLASLRANYDGNIELILVDSGSRDETRQIERVVKGAKILRHSWNIGYLAGCNEALAHAQAPSTLYLNNDVRLYPGALESALERLYQEPKTGAVVAKLVRSNMRLQEAGSIIWRDGATYGYRREDDPNLPEANFVRSVDFGSAAFLLARTGLLKRAGGYDSRFRPAYFEDTDLCVRLHKLGADIVYEPLCVVEHLEFGTSGSGGAHTQIQRNFRKFSATHQAFLRGQQPPHVRNAPLGRQRKGDGKSLLLVEDRIPLPGLGSGYVRSHDIICALAAQGWQVTVFPMHRETEPFWHYYGAFPENVELALEQDFSTFSDFLAERTGCFDVLWVGRTHNLKWLLPYLNEYSRYLLGCTILLDTEVVAAPRTLLQAHVTGKTVGQDTLAEMVAEELACASCCQRIIAVTEADAALVRGAGYENVQVLGHSVPARPTPNTFAERENLLFVGALHSEESPNYDSLLWFAREVMPKLTGRAAQARLSVAGYVAPGVNLTPLSQLPNVELLGAVEDLEPLYNQHRVFIAPTRFAGGLPYKVHEAASYGVPVVATELLRTQVGWENGEALMSAPAHDAQAFADRVSRVYEEPELWEQLRQGELAAVQRDTAPEIFHEKLATVLNGTGNKDKVI